MTFFWFSDFVFSFVTLFAFTNEILCNLQSIDIRNAMNRQNRSICSIENRKCVCFSIEHKSSSSEIHSLLVMLKVNGFVRKRQRKEITIERKKKPKELNPTIKRMCRAHTFVIFRFLRIESPECEQKRIQRRTKNEKKKSRLTHVAHVLTQQSIIVS